MGTLLTGLAVSKSALLETTLSTAQASISVLLVMGYGAAAEKYKLMTSEGEKNISHLGVSLFLPALLFSEIGPQATASNLASEWIIIVLAVWFQVLSYVAGVALRKLFKLPRWVVPCLVFNNVTSLPLLMFSSLESHGTLDDLARKGESVADVSSRARNYILINALVCNLARFLFGPSLMLPRAQVEPLNTHHETPHVSKPDDALEASVSLLDDSDLEHLQSSSAAQPAWLNRRNEPARTSFRRALKVLKSALNPPLMGGLAAVIVGVVPFLHRLILASDAPLFSLTRSIETIGGLYTALQMFVLGGQLYGKRGSKADLGAFAVTVMWRFFAMPAISISTVYFLCSRGIIKSDPIFDFVLAIVPVGPPAISLAAIADLAHLSPEMEGSIDRTLMYSYLVTPIISLPATAALTVVKKLHRMQ